MDRYSKFSSQVLVVCPDTLVEEDLRLGRGRKSEKIPKSSSSALSIPTRAEPALELKRVARTLLGRAAATPPSPTSNIVNSFSDGVPEPLE